MQVDFFPCKDPRADFAVPTLNNVEVEVETGFC